MSNEKLIDSITFPKDSNPFGVSYAEWTAKWWQWALSTPNEKNPLNDKSDKCYEENQTGPVWFLASTTDISIAEGGDIRHKKEKDLNQRENEIVIRRCKIPRSTALLLPILNYGATFADEPSIRTEEELISLAKSEMDKITKLFVKVDELELNGLDKFEKFRVRSPMYDVVLPKYNIMNGNEGPTRGAAEGYWLFLKPLSKGYHEIETIGSCRAGAVIIQARYEIMVSD